MSGVAVRPNTTNPQMRKSRVTVRGEEGLALGNTDTKRKNERGIAAAQRKAARAQITPAGPSP
jgi:hypothetical protein